MRGDIWVGDVIRAMSLANDERERVIVLRILGFEANVAPARITGAASAPPPAEKSADPAAATEVEFRQESAPALATHRPRITANTTTDLPLLVPLRTESESRVPLEAVPVARAGEEHILPDLPYQPLFAPRSSGAIVRAALSLQVREGPIDVPMLVDAFARGKPITSLPRTLVPTLRFGVQVLVDRSLGMQPFRRDQDELVDRINSMVGRERTEVVYFANSPLRDAGPGPTWTWGAYSPPMSGARVLLLSDLGLGGNADDPMNSTRDEWEEFVRSVNRAGSTIVAFIPHPPSIWPGWLSALIPLITWDRHVTAAQVAGKV